MKQQSPRGTQSNTATMVALLGLILLGACLVGLVALVTPAALGIVVVGFGFFLVGAFHYLTWGWWFMRSRGPEDSDEHPRDD